MPITETHEPRRGRRARMRPGAEWSARLDQCPCPVTRMSRPARNRTLPSVSTSCCTGVDRLERDRRRQDRTRPAAAGHGPVDLPPGTRPRPDGGQARHRGHPCPAERHAGTAPVHLCRTPPQAGRPHRPDPDHRPPGPQPRHLAAGQIGHCAPRTGPGDGRVASRPHSPTGRAGRAGWEDASFSRADGRQRHPGTVRRRGRRCRGPSTAARACRGSPVSRAVSGSGRGVAIAVSLTAVGWGGPAGARTACRAGPSPSGASRS